MYWLQLRIFYDVMWSSGGHLTREMEVVKHKNVVKIAWSFLYFATDSHHHSVLVGTPVQLFRVRPLSVS